MGKVPKGENFTEVVGVCFNHESVFDVGLHALGPYDVAPSHHRVKAEIEVITEGLLYGFEVEGMGWPQVSRSLVPPTSLQKHVARRVHEARVKAHEEWAVLYGGPGSL